MILSTTLSGRKELLEQLVDSWDSTTISSMWAVSLTWGEFETKILFQ